MQSLHDIMLQLVARPQLPTGLHRRALLLAGLAAALPVGAMGQTTAVRVLAASDLKFALADIANQYQRDVGVHIHTSLGSSGNFARQIAQGLPADIFMSADESLVTQLVRAGHTQGEGVLYAIGRIALLLLQDKAVPSLASASIHPDGLRALLRSQLAGGSKFAIANPEHAPYGRAAREALQALGLWEAAQAKLVLGENIAQATQFVSTGAAQAGITALSLALSPAVSRSAPGAPASARALQHLVLPDTLHAPLRQQMVLLKHASPAAQTFFAHLQSPAVRAVLERYGFGFDGKNGR